MKYGLFLLMVLSAPSLWAQDDDPVDRAIHTVINVPVALDLTIEDTASVAANYTEQISKRTGKNRYTLLEEYRYRSNSCGDGSYLARKIKADSFAVIPVPFSYIGTIDTMALTGKKKGLIIYGDITCYGSGSGSTNNGLMIIGMDKEPMLFFQVFYGCGVETFAHGISEAEADQQTYSYVREVTVGKGRVIISANKKRLSAINKNKGSCDITRISSGTYMFRDGRFVKLRQKAM